MGTLHGILAELGIERPVMHPEREEVPPPAWMTERTFVPQEGRIYELAYETVTTDDNLRLQLKRVRIHGPEPAQWFDLDENNWLDPIWYGRFIHAFRQIE